MPENRVKTTVRLNEVPEEEPKFFAAKIRAGRAVLGWSQTDLGNRTGVTQRAIYKIEDGATRPHKLTRLRIEKAFDDAGIEFKSSSRKNGFTMLVRFVGSDRDRHSSR